MRKIWLFTMIIFTALFIGAIIGCASAPTATSTKETIEPDKDHAVVYFLRPSKFGSSVKFGLWDNDSPIGIIKGRNYIAYKTVPGTHYFMARAENWAIVKADLSAGKTYYILAAPVMGAFKARVDFRVQNPDNPEIQVWISSSKQLSYSDEWKAEYSKNRVDDVRAALEKAKNDQVSYERMKPTDGK